MYPSQTQSGAGSGAMVNSALIRLSGMMLSRLQVPSMLVHTSPKTEISC
jgi:hypothetical protein